MPVKTKSKVVTRPEEFKLYDETRRQPVKKRSVYRTVFFCLQKYYKDGKIHELTFENVSKEVHKHFPDSKFNPFHFAHYKHKFLIEAPR